MCLSFCPQGGLCLVGEGALGMCGGMCGRVMGAMCKCMAGGVSDRGHA